MSKVCKLCGGKYHAKDLCAKHYSAMRGAARFAACDKEAHRIKVNAWRAANVEKARAISRGSHHRAKEKRNKDSAEYRIANLERMRELGRNWAKNNPDKARALNGRRRAAKKQAIPKWSKTEFEVFAIKEIYSLAALRTKVTGIEWHVDHLVPLRSNKVSGLHCSANLSVVTASENHRKGNRHWPNM